MRDDAPEPTSLRDRLIVLGALALIAALGWAWTLREVHAMQTMDHSAMRQPGWSWRDLGLLLVMWIAMMVAMMTPAVAPMVTAFATINRSRRGRGEPAVATAVFLGGYLLAWTGFSLVVAIAQAALHSFDLLDPMMEPTSRRLSAALFLLAGLYQLSPLKEVCLSRCRSTHGFILSEWRDGPAGALAMGALHGAYCVGCCAILMLLLFAVSVMSVAWVAALTALVMAEKLLPYPAALRWGIGVGLLVWGASLWLGYPR